MVHGRLSCGVPVIIEKAFDAPHRRDGNILIPQLPPREIHHVLLRDTPNHPLDLLGVHPSARGDDLATNVFGDGGGAVQGEEDGGFELGLGPLGFGAGDVVGEAGPFAEGEVDEVVDLSFVFGDEVDPPEASGLLVTVADE